MRVEPVETLQKTFIFKTELSLVGLTGFKAADLRQFLDCLKRVPESSIYYHTHNFLRQHLFLVQEPPNDFAYWVTHLLNESKIGERLEAIDTERFPSLEALRKALIGAIEPYIGDSYALRHLPPEQEFHFMKSILYVIQTPYQASTPKEFVECLKKISVDSLYYHLFEARLRTSRPMNDFSAWFEAHGEPGISAAIKRLDPYSRTMEGIRNSIVQIIETKRGKP